MTSFGLTWPCSELLVEGDGVMEGVVDTDGVTVGVGVIVVV